MKKALSKILCGATLLLWLPLTFTSCEEILGEWSKPAPIPGTPNTPTSSPTPTPASKTAGAISFATTALNKGSLDPAFTNELTITGDGAVTYSSSNETAATVDPTTGEVTLVGAGTTSITATVSDSETYAYETKSASYNLEVTDGISYQEWDGSNFITKNVASSGCQVVTSSTTEWNGSKTYVVNGNVTISGNVTVSANSSLILCDGAKLTINGKLYDGNTSKNLTIYAQSDGDKMGALEVTSAMTANSDYTMRFFNLTIHGGKITATANNASYQSGYGTLSNTLTMYGGDLTAQGNGNNGAAIDATAAVNIQNKAKLWAIGSNNSSVEGDDGIRSSVNGTTITVSGDAILTATGGNSSTDLNGGDAVSGSNLALTASGNARVMLTGGNTSGNARGGLGVNGSVTASGKAIVEITAGNGSTGGNGIYEGNTLTISENASVIVKGGNATYINFDAGYATDQVDYKGGSLTVTGGVNSLNAAKNGKAIKTSITNNSGSAVDFEYSTDGTTWTTNSVAGSGTWNDANVKSRFVRTKQ